MNCIPFDPLGWPLLNIRTDVRSTMCKSFHYRLGTAHFNNSCTPESEKDREIANRSHDIFPFLPLLIEAAGTIWLVSFLPFYQISASWDSSIEFQGAQTRSSWSERCLHHSSYTQANLSLCIFSRLIFIAFIYLIRQVINSKSLFKETNETEKHP